MSCRCVNCKKMVLRDYCVLNAKGERTPIEFCSRKCYLDFWKGCESFKPLKTAGI